jgi:hypothetical protein
MITHRHISTSSKRKRKQQFGKQSNHVCRVALCEDGGESECLVTVLHPLKTPFRTTGDGTCITGNATSVGCVSDIYISFAERFEGKL